jgi:hypothetical protein
LSATGVPGVGVLVAGGWAMLCLAVSSVVGWNAETLLVVPNSLVIIVCRSAPAAAAVRLAHDGGVSVRPHQ